MALLARLLLTDTLLQAKRIVVCWHHGTLPQLMLELGCQAESYPDPWEPMVFNLILQVDFAPDRAPVVTSLVEPF